MNAQFPLLAPGAPMTAKTVFGAALSTPRVPTQPTLIRPLPQKPLQAESLDALARHIHQLRDGHGLRIGPVCSASHGGSDTFRGFHLYALDPLTGEETFIGFAAVQSEKSDILRDALARTEPRAEA